MGKPKLVNKKPERLFVFGCSMTRYLWITWADIIAKDLDCEFFNFANSGNSNDLIFNSLMQADSYFKFNENDLVIICWTGITRESRFFNGKWIRYTRAYPDNEGMRKFENEWFDNNNSLLKSLAYQKAATDLLEYRNCQSHQMSMVGFEIEGEVWNPISNLDIDSRITSLYINYLNKLLPSIYSVLYNFDYDLKEKQSKKDVHSMFTDLHPLPYEFMNYLQSIFDHEFKQTTIDALHTYNAGLFTVLKNGFDKEHKFPLKECTEYSSSNYLKLDSLNTGEFKDLFFI